MASDGNLPTGDGWFWAALAASALIGKGLEYPLRWLGCYFGWVKKTSDARIDNAVKAAVALAVENAMSPIRQHVAEVQKGVEGKQGVLDGRLADLYKEMRDRDEALTEALHKRISASMREQERRVLEHIGGQEGRIVRQIDQMGKHFSQLLTMALKATPPGE